MADATPEKIRIFCVCGQKMKVSPEMLGRNGKCIACSQKIRIPNRDEIPEGDTEIHLKDHPEFLRKAARRGAESSAEDREEPDEVRLGEMEPPPEDMSLDNLNALQRLCSVEYMLAGHRNAFESSDAMLESHIDRSTLEEYSTLTAQYRSELEKLLRRRLHETTRQCGGVREQIARANLAVRTGEMEYTEYISSVFSLRKRRERLEYRRQNLKGWLAVRDPWLAGGLLPADFGDIPVDKPVITWENEPEPDRGPASFLMERLQAAFREREEAAGRLEARLKMEQDGSLSESELQEHRRDTEAHRIHADKAIAFYRTRLEQVLQDYDNDIAAIRSLLENARQRLQEGEVDETAYQALEMELLRAQNDQHKARAMVQQALRAESAADMALSRRSTFLERLNRPIGGNLPWFGADSWLAWTAAILLLIDVAALLSRGIPGGSVLMLKGMVLGLFIFAVLLGFAGVIPARKPRGTVLHLLWFAGCVLGGGWFHEMHYAAPYIAATSDPFWYLGNGTSLMILAGLLLGISACISFAPFAGMWRYSAGTAGATALALALIFTNFGGLLQAWPEVASVEAESSNERPGFHEIAVRVRNRGLRVCWLGGKTGKNPCPVDVQLLRETGKEPMAMGPPVQVRHSNTKQWSTFRIRDFPAIALKPGEHADLRWYLRSGAYTLQLASAIAGRREVIREFSLEPLPEELAQEQALQPEPVSGTPPAEEPAAIPPEAPGLTPAPAETASPETPPQVTESVIVVELRGLIRAGQETPLFAITLYMPDGRTRQRTVMLGETVYSQWEALEFNPAARALTISDGKEMLVIRPGERLDLSL
jgi:hypothetical protein